MKQFSRSIQSDNAYILAVGANMHLNGNLTPLFMKEPRASHTAWWASESPLNPEGSI
jgi:hypothetical protein